MYHLIRLGGKRIFFATNPSAREENVIYLTSYFTRTPAHQDCPVPKRLHQLCES